MTERIRKSAEAKAMELLLARNRSEAELRKRLLEGEYSEEETQAAIDYVASYGYLNDRAFAEQYAASRKNTNGKMAIARELRIKGISEEIIGDVLLELPDDETEVISGILRKRMGDPHRLSDSEYRRIASYLARHGFSGSAIHKAISLYHSEAE